MTLDNVSETRESYLRRLRSCFEQIDQHNTEGSFWFLKLPDDGAVNDLTRFGTATRIMGSLTVAGINVFSGDIHEFLASKSCSGYVVDEDVWRKQLVSFLNSSKGMIVAELPGWKQSVHLKWWIDQAQQANKPVVMMPVFLPDFKDLMSQQEDTANV